MNNFEKEIHNDEKNFHSFVFYQNNRNFANAFCIYIHLMNSIKPAMTNTNVNDNGKRGKIKKIAINLVGILLLAIGLSRLMTYNLTAFVSPAERVVDYQSSDFYQLVVNSRNERQLDSNVVIVPVDSLSRLEIAMLLSDVSVCNPTAIGLDVMFGYPSEGDSLVWDMLCQTSSLVLPMGVEKGDSIADWITKEAYLFDETPVQRGVVNLDISSLYGVVRTFRPYYETNHGRVHNIATALAQMSAPETVERLQQVLDCQGEETVRINYDAREYEIVNSSEVLEHPEVLENKIVLIGMLNDPQDVHITPIGEYTPGLMVHAHALSTILNGDYLTTPPQWVQWMFALLLCICFVLARVFLATYRAGSLLMRLFQVVMLLLVILMGTLLFVHYHLIVELSLPLSLITLAFLTLDVWKGVLGLLNIKNI